MIKLQIFLGLCVKSENFSHFIHTKCYVYNHTGLHTHAKKKKSSRSLFVSMKNKIKIKNEANTYKQQAFVNAHKHSCIHTTTQYKKRAERTRLYCCLLLYMYNIFKRDCCLAPKLP